MASRRQWGQPPQDIPAARLFRLLSTRNRPVMPIGHRLAVAPEEPLFVRALRGAEIAHAYDRESSDHERDALHATEEVIAASLLTREGLAFGSGDAVRGLYADEVRQLGREVEEALRIISPVFGLIDRVAWENYLGGGAFMGINAAIAGQMYESSDVTVGMGGVFRNFRPDRYYGRPVVQLVDAQLLAFDAACEAVSAARR